MRGRIGRLVVVGGHSRGVGKTAMIEHVLRSRPDDPWSTIRGLGRWVDQRVAGLPRGTSGRTASTGGASSR